MQYRTTAGQQISVSMPVIHSLVQTAKRAAVCTQADLLPESRRHKENGYTLFTIRGHCVHSINRQDWSDRSKVRQQSYGTRIIRRVKDGQEKRMRVGMGRKETCNE